MYHSKENSIKFVQRIFVIATCLFLAVVVRGRMKDHCPEVKPLENFNIFAIMGPWYVLHYYSSPEEALTYHCMRVEFGLSKGNMDMIMRLTYKYADDPNDETQIGNMTWQIPDPRHPEHWRHTEDPYKGVYNTDVIDTDYNTWLLLLHCSDPEEEKFLSTFVLSRFSRLDKVTTDYLREKVGHFDVPMDYLFPVNQTNCFGEVNLEPTEPFELVPEESVDEIPTATTDPPFEEDGEELYD